MKIHHFSLKVLLGAIAVISINCCKTEKELTVPKTTTPPTVTPLPTTTPPDVATLVFKNGFEGTTRVEARTTQHDNILGNDGVPLSDWSEDLIKNKYFGMGQIVYEQGDYSQRKAEIVSDPENASNKVKRV